MEEQQFLIHKKLFSLLYFIEGHFSILKLQKLRCRWEGGNIMGEWDGQLWDSVGEG